MGELSDYFSLLDAARELGLSKSRLEQFVKEGRITCEWFSGRRVVAKSLIAEFKKTMRRPGRPPKTEQEPEENKAAEGPKKPTVKKGKK